VLKAFKDIAEELNIDLLFLGDVTHGEGDQYLQELKNFVSVNQLEDRVSFRAYRQDVECFYSAVDLMIVPSLFESFGRVTLEGMCYGIPVIGANTGGTAELIGKENDDFLFDPLDHIACSRIIHRLFSDNELRLQFGKKLLKRVDDRFSHNAVLKQLEELLHSSIT
jgi:glycosyltransferase involved in cell wall biosynthesis